MIPALTSLIDHERKGEGDLILLAPEGVQLSFLELFLPCKHEACADVKHVATRGY